MLNQTVEAVFPFRSIPPRPKPKPAPTAAEIKKAPAWDSAAQAAQQAAAAEAAAKAAAAVDLGGERPSSPLPTTLTVTPEDILFFSPGDRIVVLQQFRGSPWWLGAVKLCSQEQAHSRLRAMERLNAAASHSEIASSPILVRASTNLAKKKADLAAEGKESKETEEENSAPTTAPAAAPTSATCDNNDAPLSILSETDEPGSAAPTSGGSDQPPKSGGLAGGKGSPRLGGALTNDSITAKLVRHASRRSVKAQLESAQKDVTMQDSFANMRMAFGEELEEEETGGGEGSPTGPSGDKGASPLLSPKSFEGSGIRVRRGTVGASQERPTFFALDAPLEKSMHEDKNGESGNFLNSSFALTKNMGGSFAGNASFIINRDLGDAIEKALLNIPGNYNVGKPYDIAIDGQLFNFRSHAAMLSPEGGPMTSPSLNASAGSPTLPRKGSIMVQGTGASGTLTSNASFSVLGSQSFRLGGAAVNIITSPTDKNNNNERDGAHLHGNKVMYRMDAYKIGLFYVPFTRSLEDLAKLTTTSTEDGRKAKDTLKDVTESEKAPGAKPSAGDAGTAATAKSITANDAKSFVVPMETKTSTLRSQNENQTASTGVKYHNVVGKVGADQGKGAGQSKDGMYYQSANASSAGRGKQQSLSDEDDRRLRKLLGLEVEEDDKPKVEAPTAGDTQNDKKKDGFDFEGNEFRRALIEMQATSDNIHTQEQLDQARIKLLKSVIKSTGSSFERQTTAAVSIGSGSNESAISDQLNQVHRQLLDKAINLRTSRRQLKRDEQTLKLRETRLADQIKADAKAGRGGAGRATIVTSLLSEANAKDEDFDLAGTGMLGGRGPNSTSFGSANSLLAKKNTAATLQGRLEGLQSEVEVMKAQLKLCSHRRDQSSVRVEVLNAYADGVEEDAPHFDAFAAVEKENALSEELAAVIASGGKPPQQLKRQQIQVPHFSGSDVDSSPNREMLSSSFGPLMTTPPDSGSPRIMEERPPSPPTEAALIEEPKAKKLLKKISKRIEEAEATLEDYGKQKRKLEKRIEKNGNVLKEITKALATHKENALQREKLLKDALGDAYEAPQGEEGEEEEVDDTPVIDGDAPELPPMNSPNKKKNKNAIAAAEEESDPRLSKVPSEVRHQIKMLLFDPAGIPEHQQSVDMIEKCRAAVEKLASKTKKAQKSSSANAEATAGLRAERDKLQRKIAKGDAATNEVERTLRVTKQECESIERQALNAKANCEAIEKELAAKKQYSADVIKSWKAKQKEAGTEIEALKAKIEVEKDRVAKFEAELKALEEKRAAAESAK